MILDSDLIDVLYILSFNSNVIYISKVVFDILQINFSLFIFSYSITILF